MSYIVAILGITIQFAKTKAMVTVTSCSFQGPHFFLAVQCPHILAGVIISGTVTLKPVQTTGQS